MEEISESLKRAIAKVSVAGRRGTGYLVAPGLLATSRSVVADAAAVEVELNGRALHARIVTVDADHDIAVLAMDGNADAEVEPVPLAKLDAGRLKFLSSGFSAEAGHPRRSFSGWVLQASGRDEKGRLSLQLFSKQLQQGEVSASSGLKGSPIVVAGKVVGHLTHALGGNDSYGVAYALPARAVADLITPAPDLGTVARAPAHEEGAAAAEEIPEGHYHVFISYRSTDRKFALSLRARLEGAGLRVFLDQKELEAGESLSLSLQQAAANSRAAVVLVSQDWLASRWCQKEASVLLKRSIEDERFKLVPLRLDGAEMPVFLDDLVWLDFSDQETAAGPGVDSLLHTLLSSSKPVANHVPTWDEAIETQIQDAFLRHVETASNVSLQSVMRIVEDWYQYGSDDHTILLTASEILVGLNHPEHALQVLARAGNGPRSVELRALALAKSGRGDEAIQLLGPQYRANPLDAETGGILAGIYMRRWSNNYDEGARDHAYRIYRNTWERTHDTYNGINAAALAIQIQEPGESRRLALATLQALEKKDPKSLTHWDLATFGEAHLLLGNLDEAKRWYREAFRSQPARIQDISVMRSQACLDLKALGKHSAIEAFESILPLPTVLAFAGHMTDLPDRPTPRFPKERIGDVRRAIRERLENMRNVYGYSGAARGSDILFLEELLRRGGRARVILPFRVSDYKRTSVGHGWNKRFDKVIADGRVELVAPDIDAPEDAGAQQDAFAEANEAIYSEAAQFARGLGQEPRLLAVWDGKEGDGPGGTADALAFWRNETAAPDAVEIIDVKDPLGTGAGANGHRAFRFDRKVAAFSLLVVATFIVLVYLAAWQTDLILDTRQIVRAQPLSDEVVTTEGFDPTASAGLFMGVRHFEKRFSDVPFAVDDAVDLAHLFSLDLGLIDPTRVVLALSGQPQKWVSKKRLRKLLASGAVRIAANRNAVINALSDIRRTAGENGFVIAAFASHGFSDAGQDFVVAANSGRDRIKSTGIPMTVLFDDVTKARARRRFVLLDACREPLPDGTRNIEPLNEAPQQTMSPGMAEAVDNASGVAVLFGTTPGGFSYDDFELRNGVFTAAIIAGLSGEAKPEGEFITIQSLAAYVHDRVRGWVRSERPEHINVSKGIHMTHDMEALAIPLAEIP